MSTEGRIAIDVPDGKWPVHPLECEELLDSKSRDVDWSRPMNEYQLGELPSSWSEPDGGDSKRLLWYLFRRMVASDDVTNFVDRAGQFVVWVTRQHPEWKEDALSSLQGMSNRWRLSGAFDNEKVLSKESSEAFAINEEEVPLFVIAKIVVRLGQMRGSHQFQSMIELINEAENQGRTHPQIRAYKWFAELGGGAEPLSKRVVKRAFEAMASVEMRRYSFLIVNGIFLAPPSDEYNDFEAGEAIEKALSGHLYQEQTAESWDKKTLYSIDLQTFRSEAQRPVPVVGYFLARSFRLQGRYKEAFRAIDYAFRGLDGDHLDDMLMGQLEREREAIREAREFRILADEALKAKSEIDVSVEQLRVENAQLIATFTGFFAFIFGALALFFNEQEVVARGREIWEIVLVNLSILAPAGVVLALLILLTRMVFRKPKSH